MPTPCSAASRSGSRKTGPWRLWAMASSAGMMIKHCRRESVRPISRSTCCSPATPCSAASRSRIDPLLKAAYASHSFEWRAVGCVSPGVGSAHCHADVPHRGHRRPELDRRRRADCSGSGLLLLCLPVALVLVHHSAPELQPPAYPSEPGRRRGDGGSAADSRRARVLVVLETRPPHY